MRSNNPGMHRAGVLMLTIFGLLACEDELVIDTNKNTYYDDIADITYLNDHFFSTNYDLSGNAGSQIDLLKFTGTSASIYLSDNYDLEMNGQGYLAITQDGSDLYLQSRVSGLILKCSPIGERAYLRMDDIAGNWQSSGLAYNMDNDSLLVLYRNLQNMQQYRLRSLSRELSAEASRDEVFELGFIDTLYHGVYAMEYHDSSFYLLGVDTTNLDILIRMDTYLEIVALDTLSDSTVVGLCFKEDDLYLSFRDKRIEKWSY